MTRAVAGLGVAAVLLVCLPGARPADAQTDWGTVRVPGGIGPARRIASLGGLDRPDASFLVDLSRRVTGTLLDPLDTPTELADYFTFLENLRSALNGVPRGLTVAGLSDLDSDGRRALVEALALLGLRLGGGESVVPAPPDAATARRAVWLDAVGIRLDEVRERLNAGDRVSLGWEDGALPLPLPELWQALVFYSRQSPAAQLAADDDMLFLYLGLLNLDRETRTWLATEPDLFRRLHAELAATFAAFGRGIRVRDGAIVVPGGSDAVAAWEELAGARVTDPAEFAARVLSRDRGRLAYFYDLAAHLEPAPLAWLLGAHPSGLRPERERVRFLRDVYGRTRQFAPSWHARDQPFLKPHPDPALALAVVTLNAAGTIGPAWWPTLLERVTVTCGATEAVSPGRTRVGSGDTDWLLGWLFERPDTAGDRLAMLRLLQRRFADAPEADARDLELALCVRIEMPALALSLDRMGVVTPAVYAELGQASRNVTRSGGPRDVEVALRAWQAAIALVEQTARLRALSPTLVEDLLTSFLVRTADRPDDPNGAVAYWVLDTLLPRLGAGAAADEDMETRVLRALIEPDSETNIEFEWEGLRYRLDRGGAAARSAAAIRDAVVGPRLQHLAALVAAARRLESVAATAEELRAVAAELAVIRGVVGDVDDSRLGPAAQQIAAALQALASGNVPRARPALLAAADAVAGDVLPGMAYAMALASAAGPPQIFAEAFRFHDFGTALFANEFRERAWAAPRDEVRLEGGSRVTGALLGLDMARAVDQLRRLIGDGLVDLPLVFEADRQILAERLVMRARGTDWAADGPRVAAAIRRGRAVVNEWRTAPPTPEELGRLLTAAAVDHWRVSLAAVLVAAEDWAGVDRFFTLTDFYRLGTTDDPPDGWGQPGWVVDACWCVLPPARVGPDGWLGRNAARAASVVGDLTLRLTELLEELRLPHALTEALLPMAGQDLVDGVRQISNTDWQAFGWPRLIEASRIEDYLLALVAAGVLAAPRDLEGGLGIR